MHHFCWEEGRWGFSAAGPWNKSEGLFSQFSAPDFHSFLSKSTQWVITTFFSVNRGRQQNQVESQPPQMQRLINWDRYIPEDHTRWHDDILTSFSWWITFSPFYDKAWKRWVPWIDGRQKCTHVRTWTTTGEDLPPSLFLLSFFPERLIFPRLLSTWSQQFHATWIPSQKGTEVMTPCKVVLEVG